MGKRLGDCNLCEGRGTLRDPILLTRTIDCPSCHSTGDKDDATEFMQREAEIQDRTDELEIMRDNLDRGW